MFSRGRHTGRIVGTITGMALIEIRFEGHGPQITQRLTAWALIENRFVAMVARVLIPLFGQVVDRKLRQGFSVITRVAEWATTQPGEFCEWLDRQPLAEDVREPVRITVRGCRPPVTPRR